MCAVCDRFLNLFSKLMAMFQFHPVAMLMECAVCIPGGSVSAPVFLHLPLGQQSIALEEAVP